MAKGTYRKKRLAVLEELAEHDAAWADQIRELRTSDPQGYRKEMLKADVFLAAKTGRATTLSMRPKRFGGDEDPVLVRRVLALRKAMPNLTRGVDSNTVFGLPGPRSEASDLGSVEGWTQERTPAMADADVGSVEGWKQERTPAIGDADVGSVEGWKQGRTPATQGADVGSVEGWKQGRTPQIEGANARPAEGAFVRGRAPEMVGRPDESSVDTPQTRRTDERTHAVAGGRPRGGSVRRNPGGTPAPGQAKASGGAAPGPDLSVLKGSVSAVKKALESGALDAHLDALEAAEQAGKGRKGVLAAIAGRR